MTARVFDDIVDLTSFPYAKVDEIPETPEQRHTKGTSSFFLFLFCTEMLWNEKELSANTLDAPYSPGYCPYSPEYYPYSPEQESYDDAPSSSYDDAMEISFEIEAKTLDQLNANHERNGQRLDRLLREVAQLDTQRETLLQEALECEAYAQQYSAHKKRLESVENRVERLLSVKPFVKQHRVSSKASSTISVE